MHDLNGDEFRKLVDILSDPNQAWFRTINDRVATLNQAELSRFISQLDLDVNTQVFVTQLVSRLQIFGRIRRNDGSLWPALAMLLVYIVRDMGEGTADRAFIEGLLDRLYPGWRAAGGGAGDRDEEIENRAGGGGGAPLPANAQEIADSLIAWINTPTWAASRAYLEAHPALLDPATDAVLAALLQANASDAGAVQALQQHAALLQACRTEGIAAAYARVGGAHHEGYEGREEMQEDGA